jgi:hypothetical protein
MPQIAKNLLTTNYEVECIGIAKDNFEPNFTPRKWWCRRVPYFFETLNLKQQIMRIIPAIDIIDENVFACQGITPR